MPKYRISGWVQVEVWAEFEATSDEEARKHFNREEATYGKGNGSLWDYNDGNWVSPVTIESVERILPQKDGRDYYRPVGSMTIGGYCAKLTEPANVYDSAGDVVEQPQEEVKA